ncbi:MAG: hypothetical protein NVS9B14_22260 [Candidatus Acidiferrum sp.]
MELQVESESVIDEFLDVKGNLRRICGADARRYTVILEAKFDGYIEERVSVWVDVIHDGGREK